MKRENIKKAFAIMGVALVLSACTKEGGSLKIPSVPLPSQGVDASGTDVGDLDGSTEVSVKVTTLNQNYVGEFNDKEETLLTQVIHQVHLVSGNKEVAKLLEKENEETLESIKETVITTLVREAPAYYSNREFEYTAALEYTSQFVRADSQVLSLYWIDYGYLGGVHPYTMIGSDNYDMQTGKAIEFTDVVTDVKGFAKAAIDEIANSEEYGHNYKAGAYDENLEKATFTYLKEGALAWTITKDGIELWYGDYMSGAYASGHITILIPYETHKELMNGQYFENVEDYDVTSRVAVDRAQPESIDAFEYCYQEAGFVLYDFNIISGLYLGEDGSTLEINNAGYYVCQNESTDQSYYVCGELRVGEGSMHMLSDVFNGTGQYETKTVGELVFQSEGLSGGLYQNKEQTYTLTEKYEKEGRDTSSPWGGKETRLDGCDIVLFEGVMNEHPFDEADMSIDEYTRTFWLYSERDVTDLQLFNVDMVASLDLGLVHGIGELWFSKARFTTDDLWRVTVSMPGDLPCNGFSYVNVEGMTKYYAIGDSGEDGSLYIEEFVPQ